MIEFKVGGSTAKTEAWLRKMSKSDIFSSLSRFGQEGVNVLASATPVESGETANAWYYEIVQDGKSWSIIWGNDHVENGRPIAILIQYGHGTGTGGYVVGRDYINPPLKPIFDRMAEEAWKVVTSS